MTDSKLNDITEQLAKARSLQRAVHALDKIADYIQEGNTSSIILGFGSENVVFNPGYPEYDAICKILQDMHKRVKEEYSSFSVN